jgi:hypothetical protein
MCVRFSVCVCVCVQVEVLRRADHPSKESYRLSLSKKLRKLSPLLQKAGASSQVWEQRGRQKRDEVFSVAECLINSQEGLRSKLNSQWLVS